MEAAKKLLKTKLVLSAIALLWFFAGAAMLGGIWFTIPISILYVIFSFQVDKIPRHYKALKSKNLEVVYPGYAFNWNTMSWPGRIGMLAVVGFFLFYALGKLASHQVGLVVILIGAFFSAANTGISLIMFDFDRGIITGLWKEPTGYDSSLERMTTIRTEYFTNEQDEVDRVRITDNEGYYSIYKKKYTPEVWKGILDNLEKVDAYRQERLQGS